MVNGFVHRVNAGFVAKANSTGVVRMNISLHAFSVNINVSVPIHKSAFILLNQYILYIPYHTWTSIYTVLTMSSLST